MYLDGVRGAGRDFLVLLLPTLCLIERSILENDMTFMVVIDGVRARVGSLNDLALIRLGERPSGVVSRTQH